MRIVAFVTLICMGQLTVNVLASSEAFAEADLETRLSDVLHEAGSALGCYFTIERVEDRPGSPSLLSDGRSIKVAKQPTGVEELVKLLSEELKGVTVVRDAQRQDIIRLTEDKLSKIDNYVMSEKVSLKYSGSLFKMMDELKKVDSRVRRPYSHPLGTTGPDEVTDVELDAKDVPIRMLATDVVPLKGYSRIIWIATTRLLGDKPYTELFFEGWEDPDVPATK